MSAPSRGRQGLKAGINQLLFRVGARFYDRMTDQDLWREQIRKLLDHVPAPNGGGPATVLDLGTGPGVSAFALGCAMPPGSSIIGVDFSPEMIARAQVHHAQSYSELTGVRFIQADAAALPLEDASVDLVTGHSFLYLLPDASAVLREARRVLKPGGFAIFMEPRRGKGLPTALQRVPKHLPIIAERPSDAIRFGMSMLLWRLVSGLPATGGRFDEARARRLFAEAGFTEVRCRPTLAGLGLHCIGRRQQDGVRV